MVKERYKLPVAVWWVGMPIYFMALAWMTYNLVIWVSIPYQQEHGPSRDLLSYPTRIEQIIVWFAFPFIAIFSWTFWAPFRRHFAALTAACSYLLPCGTLLNLLIGDGGVDYELAGEIHQKSIESFYWLIAGCVLPIAVYAILDRKELRRD